MRGGGHNGPLALVTGRTTESIAGTRPRAAALGWKLQNGSLRPADAVLLYAGVRNILARAASSRWTPPPALRALLAEYRAVRRGARHTRRWRGAGRTRRATRQGR